MRPLLPAQPCPDLLTIAPRPRCAAPTRRPCGVSKRRLRPKCPPDCPARAGGCRARPSRRGTAAAERAPSSRREGWPAPRRVREDLRPADDGGPARGKHSLLRAPTLPGRVARRCGRTARGAETGPDGPAGWGRWAGQYARVRATRGGGVIQAQADARAQAMRQQGPTPPAGQPYFAHFYGLRFHRVPLSCVPFLTQLSADGDGFLQGQFPEYYGHVPPPRPIFSRSSDRTYRALDRAAARKRCDPCPESGVTVHAPPS